MAYIRVRPETEGGRAGGLNLQPTVRVASNNHPVHHQPPPMPHIDHTLTSLALEYSVGCQSLFLPSHWQISILLNPAPPPPRHPARFNRLKFRGGPRSNPILAAGPGAGGGRFGGTHLRGVEHFSN